METSVSTAVPVQIRNRPLESIGLITDTHAPLEVIRYLADPLAKLSSCLDLDVHLGDVAIEKRGASLSQTVARLEPVTKILKDVVDHVLEGNADPEQVQRQMESIFQEAGVDYHSGKPTLVKYPNLDLVFWPFSKDKPQKEFLDSLAQKVDSDRVIILSHEPPFNLRHHDQNDSPAQVNNQGASLLEFCRYLPADLEVFIVSGHTHHTWEEIAASKPHLHLQNGIGEMRTLAGIADAPGTRRVVNIIPLGIESGVITITPESVSYTRLAKPGDINIDGHRIERETINVLRERLLQTGVTRTQLEALGKRLTGVGDNKQEITPKQAKELDELYLRIGLIVSTPDILNNFINGGTMPDIDNLPPTPEDTARFVEAMKRLGTTLASSGFAYKLVGGSWVEMVAKSKGLGYARRHGDIDVVVADDRAVELLRASGYSLAVGQPDAAGNREDFSGHDVQTGERVGIFIKPIDTEELLHVTVEGVALAGQGMEEIYLLKKSNIVNFGNQGLTPRQKDQDDVEVLEKLIDPTKLKKLIDIEIAKRIDSTRKYLDGLTNNHQLATLGDRVADSTLPPKTKEELLSSLASLKEKPESEVIEALMAIYTRHTRTEVLSMYDLSASQLTYTNLV